jgi:hypothetical protein
LQVAARLELLGADAVGGLTTIGIIAWLTTASARLNPGCPPASVKAPQKISANTSTAKATMKGAA